MNKLRHSKDKQTNKQQPQNEREKWEKVKKTLTINVSLNWQET